MASNLLSVLGASPARRYYHVMLRAAARWSDTPSAGSMHISHERRIKARGNYESSGKAQLGGRSSLALVEMVMRARRNVEALDCAVTTNNAPLETRIGFGGYPIGQLPNRTPKGKGTRAWQKSGRQREGAEIADPQDLHDVVKAVLLQAQFQVGNTSTHRHSA